MKHPFALVLVLLALLILAPAAQSQEAAEQPEATALSTTDADRQPVRATLTLRDFMGEIRALTRTHLDQSEKATKEAISTLDKNIEHWKAIGVSFMGLLTLFGVGGFLNLLRYAREQAQIKADSVIAEELEKRVANAKDQIQMKFEKLLGEYEARVQDLVGAESQANMDDVESLREDLEQMRPDEALEFGATIKPTASSPDPGNVTAEREAQWQKMKHALLNHKFVWRSMERLSRAAGITPHLAESILQEHSDVVRLSRGKSGRTIARHQSRQPV